MTKKKTYIILAIILIIFSIVLTIIIVNRPKDSPNNDFVEENWAVNETKPKEEEPNEESNIKIVNNVLYQNFNNLTFEQQADKDDLILLLRKNVYSEESHHGSMVSAEILESSTNGLTYVLVTFTDASTQEYVLVYDDYTTHSFLNCQTIEQWEYYHSDANKG